MNIWGKTIGYENDEIETKNRKRNEKPGRKKKTDT